MPNLTGLDGSSSIIKSADKIINDAFRKGAHVADMVAKGAMSDGQLFAKEMSDTMQELGGHKLQLSEDRKIAFMKKVSHIYKGDYGFDVSLCLDHERKPNKSNKMQLADPQGSTLGNYTLQLAMMYILEFGSNLDQNKFLLRKYFPDIPASALEVQIDRGSAVNGRLNGADYNMPLPIRTPMNSYAYKYESERYAEEVRIMPRGMLFTREKGSNDITNGAAGLEQTLSYETLYGVVRIETSKNLDLADSVLRNGFNYPVGSNNTTSSGIPSVNTFVFPAPVGTYTAATGIMTPNNGLDVMAVLGAMLAGWLPLVAANRYVREIILHPLVYTAIVQNEYFQTWLRQGFVTRDQTEMEDTILRFYTIKGFENIRFVSADTSWTPNATNQATNSFAQNKYVISGSNTTSLTSASFRGFVGIDPSTQGGTLGGVIISPDVLAGSYMSGASGYGVQVYDMTAIEPQSPHIKVVPFATYTPAPWFKEAIFTIDFNVTIE